MIKYKSIDKIKQSENINNYWTHTARLNAQISLDTTSFVLSVAMVISKSDFNAVVTPQTLQCVLSCMKNTLFIQIICNKIINTAQ